jgi:hypothetical protein
MFALPLAEAPPWPSTPAKAFCASATGAPGEVAAGGKRGLRVLVATPGGLVARGPVMPFADSCPDVVAQPNGAALAVGNVLGNALVVAARDPGGAWAEPLPLAQSEDWRIDGVSSAIAPSGDAVVAWTEEHILEGTFRRRVARRAPGQPFGPVETAGSRLPVAVLAGVASTGESFLLTATIESERLPISVPVRVAVAPRGGSFGAPVQLGSAPWRSTPALAVAPDGRALVAVPDGASLLVAERAPGEGFGAPAPIGPAIDAESVGADVALAADGAAAVAWRGSAEGASAIVTRRAAGPFTAPVTLAPRVPDTGDPFFHSQTLASISGLDRGFWGLGSRSLLVTGDGHAALATLPEVVREGITMFRAGLTTLPLGGDRAETQQFGGPIAFVSGARPLELADGRPALVWSERIDESERLHLAAPDAVPAGDGAPPKVTVGAPARRTIRPGADVTLPVTCSGPCDVLVQPIGGPRAWGRLRLPRGGRGKLVLTQGSVPLAPRRLGTVRLRVTYGALGARQPREKLVAFKLVRTRSAPRPESRAYGLRAELRAGAIRVSWKVRHPGSIELFFVTGAETREWNGEPAAFDVTYSTEGRRSYRLRLRDDARVRFVTLRNLDGSQRLTVPLRGIGLKRGA